MNSRIAHIVLLGALAAGYASAGYASAGALAAGSASVAAGIDATNDAQAQAASLLTARASPPATIRRVSGEAQAGGDGQRPSPQSQAASLLTPSVISSTPTSALAGDAARADHRRLQESAQTQARRLLRGETPLTETPGEVKVLAAAH